LLAIWREEISDGQKETTQITLQLNGEYGIDFCELGLKTIDNGADCFDIFYLLENALPHLKFDVSNSI